MKGKEEAAYLYNKWRPVSQTGSSVDFWWRPVSQMGSSVELCHCWVSAVRTKSTDCSVTWCLCVLRRQQTPTPPPPPPPVLVPWSRAVQWLSVNTSWPLDLSFTSTPATDSPFPQNGESMETAERAGLQEDRTKNGNTEKQLKTLGWKLLG